MWLRIREQRFNRKGRDCLLATHPKGDQHGANRGQDATFQALVLFSSLASPTSSPIVTHAKVTSRRHLRT
jgi:hypothetical protein